MIYRLLLLFFPQAFRRRFGDDMAAVFEDRRRAARKRGVTAAAAFWRRTAVDMARHGLAERRLVHMNTSRRRWNMDSVIQDVRYGLRSLGRNPAMTITAVATLALGIGATTAVFSVADALLLSPLPFPNSERIVSLQEVNQSRGFSGNVSVPNFDDWREGVDAIEAGAAWTAGEINLAGTDGAERASAGFITGEFFEIVGATPVAGRVFGDDAREPGFENVAVLGAGAWWRLYGRSPDVIGQTVVVDGVANTVVGVVPPVAGLEHIEVWKPLTRSGAAAGRNNHAFRAYVRLRPEVTVAQAAAQFDIVAARLEAEYPATNSGWRVSLTPLQEELTVGLDETVGQVAIIVGLLLLIACTNVAGLLMSRLSDRQREFAVRMAIGAGRRRLVRQVLTESLVLSLIGAAAGVCLAWWSTGVLTRVLVADDGLWRMPSLSMPVLLFALAVSTATGLLFGLAPALSVGGTRPGTALRGGISAHGGRRMRNSLAFLQLSMASLLLVGTAMLLSGLYRTTRIDPGFDPENVMTFRVTAPSATHADEPALTEFIETLTRRLSAFPQVSSAGAMSNLPMAGNSTYRGVIRAGDAIPDRGDEEYALYQVSSPGYVAASGMRLIGGRDFTVADRQGSQSVALINESLAAMLWPDGDSLGQQLFVFTDEETPREVIGVLADIRYRGLDRPILPEYYVPFAQAPRRTMSIAMRLTAPLALPDVRRTVESLDATLPVYDVLMLKDLMRQSLAERRGVTATVTLFGLIAISLAAIGLHAIIAGGVRERRREIGIRMAVGADSGHVTRMFLRQGALIAIAAIATGFVVSAWMSGGAASLAPGIEAPGPRLLAAVAAFVLVVALGATWLPARLAARVDPVSTLRGDA